MEIYLCIGLSYLLAIYAIGCHLSKVGERYPRAGGPSK